MHPHMRPTVALYKTANLQQIRGGLIIWVSLYLFSHLSCNIWNFILNMKNALMEQALKSIFVSCSMLKCLYILCIMGHIGKKNPTGGATLPSQISSDSRVKDSELAQLLPPGGAQRVLKSLGRHAHPRGASHAPTVPKMPFQRPCCHLARSLELNLVS